MPQKQPFSPAGVQTKIDEMYGLNDALLKEQAEDAKASFTDWLNQNFNFTDPQAAYLSAIDGGFLEALGMQFSLALGNRLPITLIEPTEISPDDYSSKILQSQDTPGLEYNSVTGFKVTGSFSCSIMLSTP